MSSYIISIAEGRGNYRHIRISRDATLLDLHEAIMAAYKLKKVGSPSFRPQRQPKRGQPIKYGINKTKTAVAMRQVKLQDTGFAAKGTLIYTLAEPRVMFNCRTLQVLDEETQEPQVVQASGSSYDFKLGMQRAIRNIDEYVRMLSMREAEETAVSLPGKTQRTLINYFLAASNLHGLVPIETIHQLYNSSHPPLDIISFKMFGIIFSDREDTRLYILDKQGKVLSNGRHRQSEAHYIAEYSVVEGKAFSHVRTRQEGKPYYLPSEEEFLRWADESYMEENEYFLRLRSHLLSLGLDAEKSDECMHDLLSCIRFYGADPHEFFDILEQNKIRLKDLKAANFALNLYSKLGNNTRIHINCGYTPEEMGDLLQNKTGGSI